MAEIDPLIAEILLKGDDEFLTSLKRIGDEGAENFAKLAEAAERGASPLALLGQALSGIEVAASAATAGMVLFIEQQTELSQATELLADAFGLTAGQLVELETLFASAGVKVEQFERLANRLTITIAREWPSIAQAVRRYADENESAQLRASSAMNRTAEAQTKLQFAAAHAAQEQVSSALSVRGAELGAISARQRLSELESGPISASEKQSLAISQARLAVEQADEKAAEARTAQAEKAAQADAQALQARNAVRAAEIAERAEAEKEITRQQSNPVNVAAGVNNITSGLKPQIDLAAVSVQNLVKGLILASQTIEGIKPEPFDVLIKLADTFGADVDKKMIDPQQRLAVVNQLASTSFRNMGVTAAEMLRAIERGGPAMRELRGHMDAMGRVDPENIEKFRDALASMNLQVSLASQEFASWAAPAFTEFLETILSSLKDSDGTLHVFIASVKSSFNDADGALHLFVEGLKDIGKGFLALVTEAKQLGAALDQVHLLLPALVIAGRAFGAAWFTIPLAIGLVVTALGAVSSHMQDILAWGAQHQVMFMAIESAVAAIGVAILVATIPLAPWTVLLGAIIAAVVLIYEHWNDISDAIGHAKDVALNYLNAVTKGYAGITDAELAARDAAREHAAEQRKVAEAVQASAAAAEAGAKASASREGGGGGGGGGNWAAGRGSDYNTTGQRAAGYHVDTPGDGRAFNGGFPLPEGTRIINGQDGSINGGAPGASTGLTKVASSAERAAAALDKIGGKGGGGGAGGVTFTPGGSKIITVPDELQGKEGGADGRLRSPPAPSRSPEDHAPVRVIISGGHMDGPPHPTRPTRPPEFGDPGIDRPFQGKFNSAGHYIGPAEPTAGGQVDPVTGRPTKPDPNQFPQFGDPGIDRPFRGKFDNNGHYIGPAEPTAGGQVDPVTGRPTKPDPNQFPQFGDPGIDRPFQGKFDNNGHYIGPAEPTAGGQIEPPVPPAPHEDAINQSAERLQSAFSALAEHAAKAADKLSDVGDAKSPEPADVQSHAEGGMINGPGTPTSDSVFARLSRGEFVMKAASVQKWGAGFMEALNAGVLPGFAMGGLVPSPVRMAGTTGAGPVSTLNLSIDGRSFNGLRGPKSTVDDLTNYAISRQSSAAGKNPSWMG
jgi:hypothetical protein